MAPASRRRSRSGGAHVDACRRGGTRAGRTVVLIAAAWIWHAGRAFLGLPGVELVEILDLCRQRGA